MKASDVLLCLSLEEQRQDKVSDRLTRRGHLSNISSLRKALNRLIDDGLVVARKNDNRERFYRLAEGEAVEMALNEAWANAEAEQVGQNLIAPKLQQKRELGADFLRVRGSYARLALSAHLPLELRPRGEKRQHSHFLISTTFSTLF